LREQTCPVSNGQGLIDFKPAVAIEIKSTKVEPDMGEMEEMDDEGMPMKEAMHEMSEGEMPEAEGMEMKSEGESKITPELLEMLLAKLGK
jgi:ubiquitin